MTVVRLVVLVTTRAGLLRHGRLRTARRLVVLVGAIRIAVTIAVIATRSAATRATSYAVFFRTLEPLLSPQITPVLEHIARLGMQRPVGALARSIGTARHFDEAVVERERVSDGVLPTLLILTIVGKQVHDELIDLG